MRFYYPTPIPSKNTKRFTMLDIIRKLKETPSIAKYRKDETDEGVFVYIDINPTYFYTIIVNTNENQSNTGHSYLSFDKKEDGSLLKNEIHLQRKKGVQYENPCQLEVSLCPVLHNSKHNRLPLSKKYAFNKLNPPKLFGVFLSHASIADYKNGSVDIRLEKTEACYDTEDDLLSFKVLSDITLSYNADTDFIDFIDNQTKQVSTDSVIDEFASLVLHTYLVYIDFKLDGDHEPYALINRYLAKCLLRKDCPFVIGSYKKYYTSVLADLCKSRTRQAYEFIDLNS